VSIIVVTLVIVTGTTVMKLANLTPSGRVRVGGKG
jgi:hypothetical protein